MRLLDRAEPLGLVAGFAWWALGFVTLYGMHGLACSQGWSAPATRLVLALLYAAFLAGQLWLAWRLHGRWRGSDDGAPRTIRCTSATLGWAALAATAWTGAPVLAIDACG